jgi:prephenate dehydrogenase
VPVVPNVLFGDVVGDFTRIASSSPEMWRDITLANQHALLIELDRYQNQLARLRNLLASADGQALFDVFAHARDRRNAWLDEKMARSNE